MYIYSITNIKNNKKYVGMTSKSILESTEYYGSGLYIKRAIKKQGKQDFVKEILEICETIEELKKQEVYWIYKIKCKHPIGYNLTDGGDGVINPTKNVRKKISNKLKNLTGKNHQHYGMKRSKETKQKMRNAQLGKILSRETRDKISGAKTGFKYPKEFGEKMSKILKGIKHNKEWNEKVARNQPSNRATVQYDKEMNVVNEFYSISDASRQTGIAKGSICNCCKGKAKTAGKFIWKYKKGVGA